MTKIFCLVLVIVAGFFAACSFEGSKSPASAGNTETVNPVTGEPYPNGAPPKSTTDKPPATKPEQLLAINIITSTNGESYSGNFNIQEVRIRTTQPSMQGLVYMKKEICFDGFVRPKGEFLSIFCFAIKEDKQVGDESPLRPGVYRKGHFAKATSPTISEKSGFTAGSVVVRNPSSYVNQKKYEAHFDDATEGAVEIFPSPAGTIKGKFDLRSATVTISGEFDMPYKREF